ncbi:GNAT family N-acetyltransferase [Streptomyces sp. NBC_01565]|uniref:GNAT family N-acetyltransferase n=1 Tax=unclassified Streptomyces TaxID=2593676 RepID=UPI002258FD19|nr:GNAT family N-acetyltransferase [Streptomyces sp. NBC_01565]MCX4544191.1 GNAT family N-acetyltransferase [Streptomyces sp. NBC_01565]
MSSESGGVLVRRRTGADLGGCVDVLGEVHRRDGYPVNWPEQPDGWLATPGLLAAWVAEVDGRVVGHVGLSRAESGDAAPVLWGGGRAVAVVSRLFVGPGARGRGVGALLMARAVREAVGRGLHPVLDVVASDAAAVALYERLGWVLLGTVEQRWGVEQTVLVRCYAAPVVAGV